MLSIAGKVTTLIRACVIVALATYLHGCVVAQPYQPPVAKSTTAKLTVESKFKGGTFARTFEDNRTCKRRKLIHFLADYGSKKTIEIATDKDFILAFDALLGFGGIYSTSCSIIVQFRPQPNVEYAAHMDYDSKTEKCVGVVLKRTSGDRFTAVSDIALREPTLTQFDENSSYCEPQ